MLKKRAGSAEQYLEALISGLLHFPYKFSCDSPLRWFKTDDKCSMVVNLCFCDFLLGGPLPEGKGVPHAQRAA